MSPAELVAAQREYFNILDEFFRRTVGSDYVTFAKRGEFDQQIRANASKFGPALYSAYEWLLSSLGKFYSVQKMSLFTAGKECGGMKLVIGGNSRFNDSHLSSVTKMLLYADTILIPDPILPWIEKDRSEERFQHVQLLKTAFDLLHLKPIVDADGLPYPAIVVFPSWEKSLQDQDEHTQTAIQRLIVAFMANSLGRPFGTPDEMVAHIRRNPVEFMTCAESKKLFIAAGATTDMTLAEMINRYREEARIWKSAEFNRQVDSLSDVDIVLTGIMERLEPQYHLFENACELHAQPMLCFDQHWHYYTKCVELFDHELLDRALVKPSTLNTLRALDTTRLRWLGNVPIKALAQLRKNNENEEFRRQIGKITAELNKAVIEDIDRVAIEVAHGLGSIIVEHSRKAEEIEGKYQRLFRNDALSGWLTLGAAFIPALSTIAPVALGPAALALGRKYVSEKLDERAEKSKLTHSLMGVLATASKT